jgi:peroxiredoxin
MGAQILGLTVDSPFAQREWARQLNLNFPLVSDFNRDLIKAYDIVRSIPAPYNFREVGRRSLWLIDRDRTARYVWAETPGQDEVYHLEELLAALRDLASTRS